MLETGRELALVLMRFCLVAQMLGFSRLWATCDDFGVQVTAASAALHMWTNTHGTCLERVDPKVPLTVLTDSAALFFDRATIHTEEVFEVYVLREEHRLLMLLGFGVSTTTVAERVELLFRRADIDTRAAWTPFLRFTADRGGEGLGGISHPRNG